MIYFKFLVYFDLSFKRNALRSRSLMTYFWLFLFSRSILIRNALRQNIKSLKFWFIFDIFNFRLSVHLDQKTNYDRDNHLMIYFKFFLFRFALFWQKSTLRSKPLMIYFFNLFWSIFQKKRITKNDRLKCYDRWLWDQKIWLEDQRI